MSKSTPRERVFELDVLRFSAAIAVVFYHLTYRFIDGQPLFTGLDTITRFGYLGVVLFFMISGFVILWTAVGRTPGQFMISRFSRLYPIFWVAILITVAGLSTLGDASFDTGRILANMTMVSGYLDQPYIDGVYWTLQIELKFYFLIFILLLLRQLDNIDNWLLGWLLCSIAAWFIPYIGVFTIHPFGPYFIAGATLFLVWKEQLTPRRSMMLAACLVLCMVETYDHTHKYIFDKDPFYPLMSCFIVCALFLLMTAIAMGHVKIGERPLLFKLAMMTYPIYLLHNLLGKAVYDTLDMNRYAAFAVVLILLLAICYVLAMYVDRPLNRASNRLLHGIRERFF